MAKYLKPGSHFTVNEWSCHCGCGQMIVNDKLLDLAESVRTLLGNKPVFPTSVNRCRERNRTEGGLHKPKEGIYSNHTIGWSMDFFVHHLTIKELHRIMLEAYEDGLIRNLGLYDTFIHVDIREDERQHFWDSRNVKKT